MDSQVSIIEAVVGRPSILDGSKEWEMKKYIKPVVSKRATLARVTSGASPITWTKVE